MYEDMEDAFDINGDFFNALVLLHSTDDESTDKLRKMLDVTIERKYGYEKTLRARMPQKCYHNTKTREKSYPIGKSGKQDKKLRKNDNASKKMTSVKFSVNDNNVTENNWVPLKSFNAEVEDYSEKGEIPRISIPDEGYGDGLLCKICNGAKLGPLILLECQDCQEIYHPLCHQPPVVDIDVYDPRIVWRCGKCISTAFANFADTPDERKTKKIRQRKDTNKTKENSITKSIEIQGSFSKNRTITVEKTSVTIQKTNDGIEGMLHVEDSLLSSQETKNLSSNQLKKRIGSKLSVARVVTKQS
nr:integrator complex subunit 12-like [Nomia melanderi]